MAADANPGEAEKLALPSADFFANVKYHVLGSLKDQTLELLKDGNASEKKYISDDVTHCLAGKDAEDSALQECFDIYEVPVIFGDDWVLGSVRCKKWLPLFFFDAVPSKISASHIFKGLHFAVSGLGSKDVKCLWTLVRSHGGQFSRELRPQTTHLICGSKCGLKYEKATTKPDKLSLVTPDFVTECVKVKQLLAVTNFHPRLLVRPGEPLTTPVARKVKKKKQKAAQLEPPSTSVPVVVTTVASTTTSVASTSIPEQSQVQSQPPVQQQQQQQQGQQPSNEVEQKMVQQTQQMHLEQQRMMQQQHTQPQLAPQQQQQQQQQMQQQQHMQQQHQNQPQNQQVMAHNNVRPQRPEMTQEQQQQQHMQQQRFQMRPQQQQQQPNQRPMMMDQVRPMQRPQQQMMPGNRMVMSRQQLPQQQPSQMMSQAGPMMPQSGVGPMMSQAGPMMSQPNSMMQADPMLGNRVPMSQSPISQPHMMSSGYGPMGAQPQPGQMSQAVAMSQNHPMVSQNQPIMSHQVYQGGNQHEQPQMQYQQQQQQQQQYPQQQQSQQYSQQQQWQQQQQQYQWQQGQHQQQQPRAPNPMMIRQQQLITQHFANLPMEEKAKFSQMSPPEKQEYLAQRNLLVANHMMQQTTIVLTDQQREMLQTMDPAQKGNYIQKLRQEREMQIRQQQMMRQQQQQQFQNQQQQPPYQVVGTPHTSPQNINPQLSPNAQLRPQWSGETHPALAQVPRTPQQLQHLQRLQMQREQQQQQPQHSPSQQMVGPRPPVPCNVQQPQQQQQQPPQQVSPQNNGSQQKTKAALANMLSNRVMTPQQPLSPQPRLQMINVQPPVQAQQQQQQQPPVPQQQPTSQMMPQPPPHFGVPIRPPQFMGQPHGPPPPQMAMVPGAAPHNIRYGPPGAMPPRPAVMQQPQPPPRPPMPRPLFHGHDHSTKLPPDLCLLGCIFFICDYPDDSEQSQYCDDWRKVIRQYGGEVEDAYHPRITHLLCKTQDSSTSLQALREGKRLVTVYWLNDIVVKKVVLPPWKAIHFPLPANFERPCENMILTMTGFEGRDRDWVKEMIKIAGAKYTSYFTKHNHAIICKSCEGDKYKKAKEWKVPAVSIQWLNDVFFGNMNAVQCMNNPKYHNFRLDQDPFKIEYSLVPNLMVAWKTPIRVTPETYQKFKANPPARLKRKAEKHRLEKEEAKRMREAEENQSAIDPTTGQFIQPLNGGNNNNASSEQLNGDSKANGESNPEENHREDEVKSEKANNDDDEQSALNNTSGMRILLSGFVKSEYQELESMVKALGAEVTSQAKFATHLVMPKLTRTISFLSAISYVNFVLKIDWIKESAKEKKLLDVANYRHQDPDFEAKFSFNLAKTLARPDRHKLFEGRIFYLTPSIVPSWKKLRLVIEAAGGRVDNRRRKSVDQIRELNKPDRDPVYLIITCEHDLHIVTDVLKAKIGIFNSEFVMSAVMKGKMDFDLTRSITTI